MSSKVGKKIRQGQKREAKKQRRNQLKGKKRGIRVGNEATSRRRKAGRKAKDALAARYRRN